MAEGNQKNGSDFYENIKKFLYEHLVKFDTEYFLLLALISYSSFSRYHLAFFASMFFYWYREKSTSLLDMNRLVIRFIFYYKLFFLNYTFNLFTFNEMCYFSLTLQSSRLLFNYFYSTGHHSSNNFNYEWSLNEIMSIQFSLFISIRRNDFTTVLLCILSALVQYAITLLIQFYCSFNKLFARVEITRRPGQLVYSLILPIQLFKETERLRFDVSLNKNQQMEFRQVTYQEKTGGWWKNYFIPFFNTGIVGSYNSETKVLLDLLLVSKKLSKEDIKKVEVELKNKATREKDVVMQLLHLKKDTV